MTSAAWSLGLFSRRAASEQGARRPISRVLSASLPKRDGHSSGTRLAARLARPTRAARRERLRCGLSAHRPPLFGLAPGGVYRAAPVARGAVRSCRTVSPLPAGCVPSPEHRPTGGMLSVALSLGSPPPAVSRHRVPVEPGLSSGTARPHRWPSNRLACLNVAAVAPLSRRKHLRRSRRDRLWKGRNLVPGQRFWPVKGERSDVTNRTQGQFRPGPARRPRLLGREPGNGGAGA